jgi:hypothetical protein
MHRKSPVLAEAKDTINGGDIRVCERCLERGDIDGEVGRHADKLEAYAQDLRRLIGHLKVPTYQEWEAAMERHEALWIINRLLEDYAHHSEAPIYSVIDLLAAIESDDEKVWAESYPPNWKSYATQDVIDEFWVGYHKRREEEALQFRAKCPVEDDCLPF